MKRIFKRICWSTLLVVLIALMPIQSFAEMGEAFYYDGKNELYQEFIKNHSTAEQLAIPYESWMRANKYFGEDEKNFDIQEISVDISKPIWTTQNWTKETIGGLFDAEDKAAFLHQQPEAVIKNYIYAPVYYKGEFANHTNIYFYDGFSNAYDFYGGPVSNETANYILVDRMLKTLEEYGLKDWTPQHTFMINGFVFVLCEKDGQTVAAYFPEAYALNHCQEFNERFLRQKFLTKEQLVSAIAEHEDKYYVKPEDRTNQPTIGGGATEFEEDVSRVPWLWIGIVGGAVALVALILVFALKKKKA